MAIANQNFKINRQTKRMFALFPKQTERATFKNIMISAQLATASYSGPSKQRNAK